ncbi:MAG: chorismate mutase [Planctomycetota bacterium]
MSPPETIKDLRIRMDQVNAELVRVLHARAKLARAMGVAKRTLAMPAVDDAREQQMLAELSAAVPANGFDSEAIKAILTEVLRHSRALVADGAVPKP